MFSIDFILYTLQDKLSTAFVNCFFFVYSALNYVHCILLCTKHCTICSTVTTLSAKHWCLFLQDMLTEWGEAGPKLFLRMFQKRLTALQAQPDNIHRNQAGVPCSWRAIGEGLLCLGYLKEREIIDKLSLFCLSYFLFPPDTRGRVVPLLWPCSYSAP